VLTGPTPDTHPAGSQPARTSLSRLDQAALDRCIELVQLDRRNGLDHHASRTIQAMVHALVRLSSPVAGSDGPADTELVVLLPSPGDTNLIIDLRPALYACA